MAHPLPSPHLFACVRYVCRWGYSQLTPGIVIEGLEHGPSSAAGTASATGTVTSSLGGDGAAGVGGGGAASVRGVGGAPDDLKCFAFHGTTHYVLHVSDRFDGGSKRDTVYHRDGTLAKGVTVAGSHALSDPRQSVFVRFPSLLPELIARCDAAAAGIPLLRVDYLLTQPSTTTTPTTPSSSSKGVAGSGRYELLLGELTPYPGGGGFRWHPPSFDTTLGRLLAARPQQPLAHDREARAARAGHEGAPRRREK